MPPDETGFHTNLDISISTGEDITAHMLDPARSSEILFGLFSDKHNLLSLRDGPSIMSAQDITLATPVTFRVLVQSDSKIALQAANGMFLSRIHYNSTGRDPIEARKTAIDPFCLFTVARLPNAAITLQADNGLFLSRINYGGFGDSGGTNLSEAAKGVADQFCVFQPVQIDKFQEQQVKP